MTERIPWTTAEIVEATQGDLICGDMKAVFSGISIDSRTIAAGQLFVAIRGDVHDGHRFAPDVIGEGISGLLIDRNRTGDLMRPNWKRKGIVCVAVDDTTRALGDLAAFNRARSKVAVVAITGSNGKTTTRAMTASVVGQGYETLSTRGNLNNEIGLPLTLFELNRHHEWAVLELGMNRPGEIARLAEICAPDVGVITNIGPAHLAGLNTIEAVMHAKGELLEKMKPEGTAVLNADDPRLMELAGKISHHVIFFGFSDCADIRAAAVKAQGSGIGFTLVLPENRVPVNLRTPGIFMVSNALAAATVGHHLDLGPEEIKTGLENFRPVQGRMNIIETSKGIHIIDDTYNANPGSMEAAIRTLTSLKGGNRGIFVAGDMLELGKHADRMHKEIGGLCARCGVAKLYATGEWAASVSAGALSEAMNPRNIFVGSREDILSDLRNRLQADDWVLVKGSRSMGMEQIVKGLQVWANDN